MKFNIPRRRFRCRAERSHVVESAKWVTPPPAAPREAWREERRRRRRSERRARRAERRGESGEPHQSKPHWGTQTLPHHIFPLRAPHARPAGGGTNAFCFLSLVAPAPPGSRNCPFPTRVRAVQSLLAKQYPRVARSKRQSLSASQPVRFNVPISAFIGVSAKLHYSGREPFSPAPTFPPSRGGQGEYSRRGGLQVCASKSCAEHARLGPPLRANLSVTFPFARKGDPCAGSA